LGALLTIFVTAACSGAADGARVTAEPAIADGLVIEVVGDTTGNSDFVWSLRNDSDRCIAIWRAGLPVEDDPGFGALTLWAGRQPAGREVPQGSPGDLARSSYVLLRSHEEVSSGVNAREIFGVRDLSGLRAQMVVTFTDCSGAIDGEAGSGGQVQTDIVFD
jgi:hypothetical protein